MKKEKIITIRVTKEMYKRLDRLAASKELPLTECLRLLFELELDRKGY